ncbi:DNA polymerase epsilon subunit 3 [Durio zibethinus]|uniref:DNA polymerase epsilon subunit 3 n=1 Tax=Durio zibethinus TaxID=66656 RepID=A0A6P5XSF7_DURZI|nr:DNA polymerase epsilon subunit 3 [Durio zibethinus]
MEKVVSEAEELPKAIVRRVVKDKLSDCSPDYDINVHKDALLAFSESARIFIHYLSATANDICKESKRQTMNAEDIFKALEEIEFSEFVKPLKASLAEFRMKNAGKKGEAAKEKEMKKKRKAEDSSVKSGTKTKQKKEDNDNEEEDDENEDEEDNNGSE